MPSLKLPLIDKFTDEFMLAHHVTEEPLPVVIPTSDSDSSCHIVTSSLSALLGDLPACRPSISSAWSDISDDLSTRTPSSASSEGSDIETRHPSWSIGAEFHYDGNCKPCGFFWSQKGCGNGPNCNHCHLCPRSVRKQKKASCRRQLCSRR